MMFGTRQMQMYYKIAGPEDIFWLFMYQSKKKKMQYFSKCFTFQASWFCVKEVVVDSIAIIKFAHYRLRNFHMPKFNVFSSPCYEEKISPNIS